MAKGHCGILTEDNQVINYDYNFMKIVRSSEEKNQRDLDQHTSSFELGNIRSISSGEGFNILVTDKEEAYVQLVNGSFPNSYAIAQHDEFDPTKKLHKIDMVSDYNIIHQTKVDSGFF